LASAFAASRPQGLASTHSGKGRAARSCELQTASRNQSFEPIQVSGQLLKVKVGQPQKIRCGHLLRPDNTLAVLFGVVSLLYATVGQAGGTSFLALMAFASFSPSEMRPTALMLNTVASSYSTWRFNRGKFVDWAKLTPVLVSSLPTAFVGSLIILDERHYKTVTGLLLLSAAMVPAFRKARDGEIDRPTPLWGAIIVGAAVGFASRLTGVGDGAFLAPLLIALRWASPKQTAALSAPFILANSVIGLLGATYAGEAPTANTWLYALAAAAGASIGTSIGLRWLSQRMTRYILAVVLGAAGMQFLFF
jgi:uncharacterized protein